MATKKKMLQAAAGNAGGAGPDVDEVFSTYLYTGNSGAQTITNGIDLSGEGGFVWLKGRGSANSHLIDTERGSDKYLISNATNIEQTSPSGADVTSFNSNGFSFGTYYNNINFNNSNYASWTWRKAPKFFDIQTWSGNSTAGRTISHNLGSIPGMIIIKRLNLTTNWAVYHRSAGDGTGNGAEDYYLQLNNSNERNASSSWWNNTAPTATEFTLGNGSNVNSSSGTYVAYLFAHNDGDGEFGNDADQDIIKCGGYSGNGSVQDIDLGFEPQWVLVKNVTSSNVTAARWGIYDVMRGMPLATYSAVELNSDQSTAERTGYSSIAPYANGFTLLSGGTMNNQSANNYIYMAIRRGPLASPTDATEVFDINEKLGGYPTPELINTGNVVDLLISKRAESSGGGGSYFWDRLRGGAKYLEANSTAAETGSVEYIEFDTNEGVREGFFNTSHNQVNWTWKRAPGFCDIVAYTGNGTAGRTISHNLGVAPEMMWVKKRPSTGSWAVYHSGANGGTTPENYHFFLNSTSGEDTDSNYYWYQTAPTATEFSLGISANTNQSTVSYIAYLFASLDGVSKVGSYTGNGTNQTINCGFSAGARFILIKRTDSTGDWYVWDTERGIVAANDPHLSLNTTAAEVTTDDSIDPDNSGFIVNQVSATNVNVSSASYVYYAVS